MQLAQGKLQPDDPRAYVGEAEIRALYSPRPWCIARDLGIDWIVILGSIAAWGWFRHPVVLFVAFVLIAGRQHALNNWVHEASHFSFTRNKRINDWVSDIFAATPHFISTADYRAKHKLHHTDLGDPVKDTEVKSRFLIRGWHFWKRGLVTLFGASAIATVHTYTDLLPQEKLSPNGRLRFLALVALTNAIIFAWCAAWGVPFAWLYLWVLPLVTLTSLFATIRVIAEHQSDEYATEGREQFDEQLKPAITRTIDTDGLTAALIAPVKFNYHLEHHTWPAVPYTSLPALSRLLRERGFYERNPHLYARSYYEVLARLIWPAKAASVAESAKPVTE